MLYPASVASGALRNLISCLNNDVEDVDTTKVILETLLMLFNPDETSVSIAGTLCDCTKSIRSQKHRTT